MTIERFVRYVPATLNLAVVVFLIALAQLASGQGRPGKDPAVEERVRRENELSRQAQPTLKRALDAYYSEQYRAADEECRKAIALLEAIGPEYAGQAKLLAAEIELALGYVGDALAHFEEFSQKDPYNLRLYAGLAVAQIRLGRVQEADQNLERAFLAAEAILKNFPETAHATLKAYKSGSLRQKLILPALLKAGRLLASGMPSWALRDIKDAHAVDRRDPCVNLYMGRALRELKRWEEAKPHLRLAASGPQPVAVQAQRLLSLGPKRS